MKNVIKSHGTEKACVLTQTNDDAMQILGLLERKGVHAKLIQSLGKQFRLGDLAEIRYFLSVIDQNGASSVIPEKVWKEAKEKGMFLLPD